MKINLKTKGKKVLEKVPYPLGRFFSTVPFKHIFGKSYTQFRSEIEAEFTLSESERRDFIFKKMKGVVNHAYENTSFYRDFYDKHHFSAKELDSFEDLRKIPIVRKQDLKTCSLEERSVLSHASDKLNTGGTTGEPLEFYIEHGALAREWAHMIKIWERVGYQRTDLKLTFRGKNIGDRVYQYNPVNNEYLVNTYANLDRVCEELERLAMKREIRFIHGYPSTIYEFAGYVERNRPELAGLLNKTLKGILFGSEYPAPVFRETINRVFTCPDISWYGHSEMCILAGENGTEWVYEPFQTYGYCEAVEVEDGTGGYRLVGTSYHNTATPFIRYDTGDLITPVETEKGVLKSFKVSYGRVGEFISDQNRQQVSLTSLIFGRHHPLFGKAKFIQVKQKKAGTATIVVTLEEGETISEGELAAKFDSSNVKIEFSFEITDKPYRTSSGKVPLLIQSEKNSINYH